MEKSINLCHSRFVVVSWLVLMWTSLFSNSIILNFDHCTMLMKKSFSSGLNIFTTKLFYFVSPFKHGMQNEISLKKTRVENLSWWLMPSVWSFEFNFLTSLNPSLVTLVFDTSSQFNLLNSILINKLKPLLEMGSPWIWSRSRSSLIFWFK